MKSNLIPALLIAAAILGTALLNQYVANNRVKQFFAQLEQVATTKDANDQTEISKIIGGISKSVSNGFRQGFQQGQTEEKLKQLALRDQLVVKDVKLTDGSMKNQQRVIGTLTNTSKEVISDVTFNVIYRKADGSLMDVGDNFSNVRGTMKPGDELGFAFKRDLGEYNAKDEVLAANKADKVSLTIVDFNVLKAADAAKAKP